KRDGAFGDDARIACAALAYAGKLGRLLASVRRRGRAQRLRECLRDVLGRIAMAAEYRLDRETLEAQRFTAASGDRSHLLFRNRLREQFLGRDGRTHDQ